MAFTTLILDAPGPPLLFEEVDRFLELGLLVTLNLYYFTDKHTIKRHYGERIHYAEINCHDKPAFIAAVTQAGGYSVLKTRLNIPLDGELISAAASPALTTPLRAIAQAGVGLNHIDRQEAERAGVTILNTPGSNASAVAEYVVAQALFLSRDLSHYNAETHKGHWSKGSVAPGQEFSELTLGLVGTGVSPRQWLARPGRWALRLLPPVQNALRIRLRRTLGWSEGKPSTSCWAKPTSSRSILHSRRLHGVCSAVRRSARCARARS